MIGHITYLSDEAMRAKFDRRLQDRCDISFNFEADFQVESYLRHQGRKFVDRFDANSFLYVTKAADYLNLEKAYGNGSAVAAFSRARCAYLVVSFTSDWLYPTYQSKAMVQAMKKNGLDVSFVEITADWGHDAFLLPNPRLWPSCPDSWGGFSTQPGASRELRAATCATTCRSSPPGSRPAPGSWTWAAGPGTFCPTSSGKRASPARASRSTRPG
jgi:hypothetical protein